MSKSSQKNNSEDMERNEKAITTQTIKINQKRNQGGYSNISLLGKIFKTFNWNVMKLLKNLQKSKEKWLNN